MGRTGLVGNVVLALGAVLFGVVVWRLVFVEPESEAPAARPPYVLAVTLAEVRSGELQPSVRLTGTVRSLERARLAFETAGAVAELAVREADAVEPGQVLARLEATELALEVGAAEADLALAERELERLRAGERGEERERLRAERDAARAEVSLASTEVERGKSLLAQRILSDSDQDERIGRLDAAVGRASAAEQRLLAAEAGARVEDIAIQEARVEVERSALRLAERRLAKTELRAPWRGAVVQRLVSLGDYVNQGEDVLELIDLAQLEVDLEVPERYAARMGVNPRAWIRSDEHPELLVEARLDVRIPVADERSRNSRGLIRLAAADAEGLVPGMFVRVDLELAPLKDVLLVPADAVRIVEGDTIVVRAAMPAEAEQPPAAEWIPVRVLGSEAGVSAVQPLAGTLTASDSVVLTGVDLAFPGAPLMARDLPRDLPSDAGGEPAPVDGEAEASAGVEQ